MNFLTNKFKNELYHLTPKQEKAAKSGNEKKALKYKVKRELQRGIVHWQPPPQSGENQESHEIHKKKKKKESGRPEKDRGGIKRRMELTYAFRRRYLNEEKRHVLDIMREYPCLFEEDEVKIINSINSNVLLKYINLKYHHNASSSAFPLHHWC